MRMETVSESESGMLSSLWMMLFMAGLGWAESWSEVDVGGGGLEPNHAHLSSYSHSDHSTLTADNSDLGKQFCCKDFSNLNLDDCNLMWLWGCEMYLEKDDRSEYEWWRWRWEIKYLMFSILFLAKTLFSVWRLHL